MDYFDLGADHGGSLIKAFKDTKSHILCASFSSDGTPMPWIWIDAFNAYEQESHEVRLEIITDKANITTGAYFWDKNS